MSTKQTVEIYHLLQTEDQRMIDFWGSQKGVVPLPSMALAEMLIKDQPKEFAIALLRHISARLEKSE